MVKAPPEAAPEAKAKREPDRREFKVGQMLGLAAKPGIYLDTRSEAGLGLRVSERKAVYFVRFQHTTTDDKGKRVSTNHNITLGRVAGTPAGRGKALPELQLDTARDLARTKRANIEHPENAPTKQTLRAMFLDYLANKRNKHGDKALPLAPRTRWSYTVAFERYLGEVADWDYRAIDRKKWEALYHEIETGERADETPIMLPENWRLRPSKKDERFLHHPARPRAPSIAQGHILMSAMSGMYKRNSDARAPFNPVADLWQAGTFSTPPRRIDWVNPDDLPRVFQAICDLRSPLARDVFLSVLLTDFRRSAILLMEKDALDIEGATYSARTDMEGFKRMPDVTFPLCRWLVDTVLSPRKASADHPKLLFPATGQGKGTRPNIEGSLDALEAATGTRVTPNRLRRTFTTLGEWSGISQLRLQALTGHALPRAVREDTGSKTTRGYIVLDPAELRADSDTITSTILELAGLYRLTDINRAKLAAKWPRALAFLDTLPINAPA